MNRASLTWTIAVAACLAAVSAPNAASAKTGTVRIEIVKAGFIVGVSGGRGTLRLDGRTYPLKIGGVSLGATIGASKTELIGRAYNLTAPDDITGTYSAAEMGMAVAGGAKVAKLKNSRGVVLELKGKQIGLMISVDLSGMDIAIKN